MWETALLLPDEYRRPDKIQTNMESRMYKQLFLFLLSSKSSSITFARSKLSTLMEMMKMGLAKLRLFAWHMIETLISLSRSIFEIFGMR